MHLIKNTQFTTREGREGLQITTCIDEQKMIVLKLLKTIEQSYDQLITWGLSPEHMSEEWYENSSSSYGLAYEKLGNETGLLYYHDGLTDVGNILIDGVLHRTMGLPFLLQKKVLLVCEKIDECLLCEDIFGAKKVIDDVFLLIRKIRSKGITEDTFNYDHNYGYDSGGNMLQIDVGSFREGDTFVTKQKQNKKMLDNQTSTWLLNKSKELYEYHLLKCNELYA